MTCSGAMVFLFPFSQMSLDSLLSKWMNSVRAS